MLRAMGDDSPAREEDQDERSPGIEGGLALARTHLSRAEEAPSGLAETHVRRGDAPVRATDVDEVELELGRDLDDAYEIEELLDQGGMGKVLVALDPRLGRRVAAKVMLPHVLEHPGARRRFVIEAQVGAQLEHPHIVPVYGMEKAEGGPAFTMRLLGGEDLGALIRRRRERLESGEPDDGEGDLDDRLEILLRVCDAVAYANDHGVIHRDLKPENVMLGAHREVYVVDWGVAKVIGSPEIEPDESEPVGARSTGVEKVNVSTDAGTRAGQSIGTMRYMPPEQVNGDVESHGSASDQFALGMMLQELATLSPPRPGGRPAALMSNAIDGVRSPFVRCDGVRLPPELEAIVERATALAIEDRYPSIEAFAEDVRRFVRGEPVSVYPEPLPRRLWRRLSRRPAVTMSVVFALLLAGAVTSMLSLRETLATQRAAMARSAELEAMSTAVMNRGQQIDEQLGNVKMLVEGLAGATGTLLRASPSAGPPEQTHPFGVGGRLVGHGPPLRGLAPHDRYGMAVTFDQALYLYPPGADAAAVAARLPTLAPMAADFRELLLRSAGPGPWTDDEADGLLRGGQTPVHVVYAGFEDGLLLNYPGYEPFPEAYDPRRRPWYVQARERRGPFFGAPYPDASGSAILVPCNRAVRDGEGEVLAVVGADMAMDDVAALLRIEDLEGWTRGAIVDANRRVIIDTEPNEAIELGVDLHDDQAVAGAELPADLGEAIEATTSGWVEREDEWVFHDHLSEIDWTYLAWIAKR
jgi:serine/threonine protein kinase